MAWELPAWAKHRAWADGTTDPTEFWARYNEAVVAVSAALPQARSLRVRLEDLMADPDEVMAEILEFAGVEPTVTPELRSEVTIYMNGARTRGPDVPKPRLSKGVRRTLESFGYVA